MVQAEKDMIPPIHVYLPGIANLAMDGVFAAEDGLAANG